MGTNLNPSIDLGVFRQRRERVDALFEGLSGVTGESAAKVCPWLDCGGLMGDRFAGDVTVNDENG